MYRTPGIRLCFSVDYSAPDDEYCIDDEVLEESHPISHRKRKASDFDNDTGGILKRRRIQLPNIRTECPRSASLPPQNIMDKTPQGPHVEKIRQWMAEIPDGVTSTEDQQADPSADITNQMLEAFVRHGVPVEATSGSMFANVANAVAEIMTRSIQHAQQVSEVTSANTQYLVHENQSLREQLHQINSALSGLDERFHKFVKRKSQTEIEKSLRDFHAKVDKLREPDVTLETLSKQIEQFKRAQYRQNETIDNFKASCDKELDKVTAIRRKFNKEAKDQTSKRKDDLKDLKVGIVALEERVDALEHQTRDAAAVQYVQYSPDPHDQLNDDDVDELHEEIRILRQHITAIEHEDSRKWTKQTAVNAALSKGLAQVHKYQFGDV